MTDVALLPCGGYAKDTASVGGYFAPGAGWVPTGSMVMPVPQERPQPVPTPWIVNGCPVPRGFPVGFFAPGLGWVKEYVPYGVD